VEDDNDDQQLDDVESEEVVSAIVKEVCEDDPVQVEKDLQSIHTLGIADPVISDKLVRLNKCLTPLHLNSKIPCYCFMDNSSTITKTEGKVGKIFSPFIEVSVNNRTFSIRKTTAIWLLQENECVSSDCLFCVRDKQPYPGSSLTLAPVSFTDPLVSNIVHIGDLCVFKFGINWHLGHILQFSKYNIANEEYAKPCNDKFVEVSNHVGVLCTWYEHV